MGRGMQGVCSLGYIAIATRALGVEHFGMLVLLHSFMLAVATVAQFSSWQMLVKFGAEAMHAKDHKQFQRYLKFGFLLDGISALIVIIIMLLLAKPASQWFGIPAELFPYVKLYGLGALFLILSTSSLGVLRLLDKFNWLAGQVVIEPVIRLVGAVVLFASGAGLVSFIVLWFVALLLGRGMLVVLAIKALKQENWLKDMSGSFAKSLNPTKGIWPFMAGVQFSSTLKLSQSHLPVLLVGGLLGPTAAGLFRIAQQLSDMLVKISRKLLVPAILPELAKMQAEGNRFAIREMVAKLSLVVGVLGGCLLVVLMLFGRDFIHLLAGGGYENAYVTMIWLAVAGTITVVSFTLEPLLISTGKVYKNVVAQGLATVVYVFAVQMLVDEYALKGAGMAALVYAAALGVVSLLYCRKLIGFGR